MERRICPTPSNFRPELNDTAQKVSAAGMLEAEQQFRRIIGYRDLTTLVVAIERDLSRPTIATAAKESVTLIPD
jgi:hypothetical protein